MDVSASKNALIIINPNKKNSFSASEEITFELQKRNYDVTIYTIDSKPEKLPANPVDFGSFPGEKRWDIAFSLGGDGTVLFSARSLASGLTPILPVNLGTLGFIAGVNRKEWLSVFDRWEKNEINYSRRCMLLVSVERGSKKVMENTCLNDVVVSSTGIHKLIKLDVKTGIISKEQTELGFYHCDGLIAATPTGSTAYSMSAGGPILDPEMNALILNPICPFALSNRPLVLDFRQDLEITVANDQRCGVLLTADGQDTFNLESMDKIIIKKAPWQALLILADRLSYYSALRAKLSWSGETVLPADAENSSSGVNNA